MTRGTRAMPWLALAACLVLLPLSARAGEIWPFDPQHSSAKFSVRKFLFAHVSGDFASLHGRLRRIETRLDASLGEVDAVIDLEQLVMDDAGDRAYALGPDFFDAAHYPQIRFESDPFPLSELVTGGELRGMLELHGQRRPVTFTLRRSACPTRLLSCPIRVHGRVSRSAFGMQAWRGVLSDKVDLDMQIILVPAG